MRTGTHALSLLSLPLNIHVITALEDEPKSLMDLRRSVGSPPQTTLRKRLRELTDDGILECRRQPEFPGAVEYALGQAGTDLLRVVAVLREWLDGAPHGPIESGSVAARSAITAMIEGWSSTIVRAIAARPMALTDLNRVIANLNYPSLERRLGAMRLAGQVELCRGGGGRSRPYTATDWLRRAIAPLTVAASWERRHLPSETAPIGRIDIESVFLLVIPTLRLRSYLDGSSRLAVETRTGDGQPGMAGVLVTVEQGRVVSCVSKLQGHADAWAVGSINSWLAAMIEGEVDALELGGDCALSRSLVEGLNESLFGVLSGV